LRQEIIVRVARLHLDHIPLLAKMIDRLDQQQLDAAVWALREPLEVGSLTL
jgi:hypothetical protein